jgi:hypothetical protein
LFTSGKQILHKKQHLPSLDRLKIYFFRSTLDKFLILKVFLSIDLNQKSFTGVSHNYKSFYHHLAPELGHTELAHNIKSLGNETANTYKLNACNKALIKFAEATLIQLSLALLKHLWIFIIVN